MAGVIGAAAILIIPAVCFEFLTGGPRGSRRNAVVFGAFSVLSLVGAAALVRHDLWASLASFGIGAVTGWGALGVFFRWPGFYTPGPIDDADFGTIHYSPKGTWNSFAPGPGCPCAVRLSGSRAGPFARQRRAIRRLMEDFARLEATGRAFVDRHREDRGAIETYSLDLSGAQETADGRFTIEYIDLEALVIHRVVFSGHEPRKYESLTDGDGAHNTRGRREAEKQRNREE